MNAPADSVAPSRREWRPLPGMQEKALANGAYELFMGGAAGPGKSSGLLVMPLRWVGNPDFRAVLFRNSFPELQRTLVRSSFGLYKPLGARYSVQDHTWHFASGATIEFAYLEREADVHRYQGAEYSFCVALGTPILMADGSWRPIEAVRVGDVVATLLGPRPVTATHRPGRKTVVRVSGPHGTAVVSASHRLLTANGWASPAELMSTGCCGGDSTCGASPRSSSSPAPHGASRPEGPRQARGRAERTPRGSHRLASASSTAARRSGCAASGGSHREASQPPAWTGLAVLHGLALGPAGLAAPREIQARAQGRASGRRAAPGSRLCCPLGCRCDGGSPRAAPAGAPARTPSPDGVATRCGRSPGDGRGCTPRRSPAATRTWNHPYTKREHPLGADAFLAPVSISPAGEEEVADLTVLESSHYVASGGIVTQNCGFDELPHFPEFVYRYMGSRLRNTAGLPSRLRATGNPDGPYLDWVRRRFAPWIDGRVPDGEVRWFDPEGREVPRGTPEALSRTYIRGRLSENPHLGADYRARLNALDPVTRAKLLDGDWDACVGEGKLFHRTWWTFLDRLPADVEFSVRAWDLGATAAGDPSRGVKMHRRPAGTVPRWVVSDVVTVQGPPHEVEAAVKATAELDGKAVPVVLPQDPGQAGIAQVQGYARLLPGWRVIPRRPVGDKVKRAGGWSSQVGARNAALVRGPWNEAFVAEHHAFPDGAHDDQVDASADGFEELASTLPAATFSDAADALGAIQRRDAAWDDDD